MPSWDDMGVEVQPAEESRPGATASFPYDAALVERFRSSFPRARWRDDRRAWFVPGTTAELRLNRWLQRELSGVLAYADERGRDAFAFDPIESRYLEMGEDLLVRTPYSKTIIEQLRAVPWAWWDGDQKVWRVPFRSLDELRQRWPVIEAAAQRNEPHELKRRQEERRGSVDFQEEKAKLAERRRRRYPVPAEQLPPLDRPLMSDDGPVIFTDVTGELVDPEAARAHHPWTAAAAGDLVWASWRKPTHEELVRTWPARQPPSEAEKSRGWWQPTIDELRDARRKARSIERALETRRQRRDAAEVR
jgi:hypothetical protein